jgi:hypothetical protein
MVKGTRYDMKTLNEMLGMTYHMSPLRMKMLRLGLHDPKQWQTLAIQRGCDHYPAVTDPVGDPGSSTLSNEELALSLLLGELPYDPQAIRVSAQLLSGDVNIIKILRIAELERLEPLLHRLAKDILRFGLEHKNWEEILDATSAKDFPEGVLPHPSRYVVDQGNYVPENLRYHILTPKRMSLREE